ncbi:hypothetical protein B0H14DRAFT_3090219 [Mycena olivaceomarginata]|nr:hypothetical protein B0H14DRAFT_3091014 [Mycena olivaceomarginata]KAJ7814033.1 hypothetical protein B0H14DRAFT_3090219 [Mycena olivaceomarginata]
MSPPQPTRKPLHTCPICTQDFPIHRHLLQHMNQPNGRCHAALHPAIWTNPHSVERTEILSDHEMEDDIDWAGAGGEDLPMAGDGEDIVEAFPEMEIDGPTNDTLPSSTRPKDFHPKPSSTFGTAPTFMDNFSKDRHTNDRQNNLYYPFASADEWEVASYLARSNMTVVQIDEFLKLRLTAKMNLSFQSAKDLRSRIESLPPGPQWKAKSWKTDHPTKKPLTLYYRDPLECLQSLLANPLIQDYIEYTPFRLWSEAGRLFRVYTDWLSGDHAWDLQDKLPVGATLLGVVLSSDKTQITTMTGNRSAYPVLLTLANLFKEFRSKASHHAFQLLCIVPIADFIERNKELRGVLVNRLFHAILDFVLEPLKKTAQIGATAAHTLAQLRELEKLADPLDELATYVKNAKAVGLNGVHKPFWADYPMADPAIFLTPEILHHWLKMFWDHLCKWCIQAVGAAEIDFRFSVLRPHTGMRHFKGGISKGKQTTGREHRDIQRYLVPVIAGVVSKPFLTSIASLNDFFYVGQAPEIDDEVLETMDMLLNRFHAHKAGIMDAKARKGKNGPIENWYIPKLEFLQSVVPAIRASGVPLQWSADVTEHAHITLIKDPASNTNNQNYEPQFAGVDFRQDYSDALAGLQDDDGNDDGDGEPSRLVNSTSQLLDLIDPVVRLAGTGRKKVDYFRTSSLLAAGTFPKAPTPFRTFASPDNNTAFHLNRDHVGRQLQLDAAVTLFKIPDLLRALQTYLHRHQEGSQLSSLDIGGRIPAANTHLPFHKIEVWHSVRIQSRSFHNQDNILEPETVNAAPPDSHWETGRRDMVIVNHDLKYKWPKSGIEGHTICQLCMIFRVVPNHGRPVPPGTTGFLAYVQRFDIIPQQINKRSVVCPEPASGMYQLKRARRADGSRMGDIIPLDRLRVAVELTPCFGKRADPRLTKQNSLDYLDEFWLSKWFNKELFWALSQGGKATPE